MAIVSHWNMPYASRSQDDQAGLRTVEWLKIKGDLAHRRRNELQPR